MVSAHETSKTKTEQEVNNDGNPYEQDTQS